jgi:hypothetical protein
MLRLKYLGEPFAFEKFLKCRKGNGWGLRLVLECAELTCRSRCVTVPKDLLQVGHCFDLAW